MRDIAVKHIKIKSSETFYVLKITNLYNYKFIKSK